MTQTTEQNIKQPSIEQITAYLSGKATKEDTIYIEQYMKDNPDFVDDLLNISMAISIQQDKKQVSHTKLYLSIAACLLVLIVGIWFVKFYNTNSTQSTTTVAKTEKPQNVNKQPNESQNNNTSAIKDTTNKQSTSNISNQREYSMQISEKQTASYSEVDKEESFKLIFPRRKKEFVSKEQDIVFCWQTDIKPVNLIVYDDKHNQILSTTITNQTSYTLKASSVVAYPQIFWSITATTRDNIEIQKTGNIVFN